MKIALVYDWVDKIGGAERVLSTLHEIWPEAPLYAANYKPQNARWAKDFIVRPSFLNKIPSFIGGHESYPLLMPLAFESFNFNEFDVVLSITSSFAKGIITSPQTRHFCYCLTPTRFLWNAYDDYFRSSLFRFVTNPMVNSLKEWDKIAAARPDKYLAISNNIQQRIRKYYGLDSELVYPPVDTDYFLPREGVDNNYYLVVSRLVPYKKVDVVIKAFNNLGLPLKIAGTGCLFRELRQQARKNIEFLGQLTDQELLGYYQNCRALIFPQEEDFGLVALEAQSCGRPVIAFGKGGALETIIENQTGVFFPGQSSDKIIDAVRRFEMLNIQSRDCRVNALRFSKEVFINQMKMQVLGCKT